jgi:hypothetical protein
MAELQSGCEHIDITEVCHCSGNRRGLSEPHVPGCSGDWAGWAMRFGQRFGSRMCSPRQDCAKRQSRSF